jgi:hypothetical protein
LINSLNSSGERREGPRLNADPVTNPVNNLPPMIHAPLKMISAINAWR